MQRVVLASTSPYRARLLDDVGISCTCVAPDVDEHGIVGDTPEQTAILRASAKAAAVARRHPEAIVVGADQVAHLDGEGFGKPRDDDDWIDRLRRLRGRTHHLTTGVAVAHPSRQTTFAVTTDVTFRSDVSDEELAAYVRLGEARGCAGGYMAERRGAWLIARIEGDWSNVVGLPVPALLGHLREAHGWRFDGS